MYIPFVLSQLRAEFAVLSPRLAEKGNSNVPALFSSIRVLTVGFLMDGAGAGQLARFTAHCAVLRAN